jgi:hypothetical protein
MKTELVESVKPDTFTPVTVALTFETQAEVNEWYRMMGYNVSVPLLSNPIQLTNEQLGDTMSQLRRLLKDKVSGI